MKCPFPDKDGCLLSCHIVDWTKERRAENIEIITRTCFAKEQIWNSFQEKDRVEILKANKGFNIHIEIYMTYCCKERQEQINWVQTTRQKWGKSLEAAEGVVHLLGIQWSTDVGCLAKKWIAWKVWSMISHLLKWEQKTVRMKFDTATYRWSIGGQKGIIRRGHWWCWLPQGRGLNGWLK